MFTVAPKGMASSDKRTANQDSANVIAAMTLAALFGSILNILSSIVAFAHLCFAEISNSCPGAPAADSVNFLQFVSKEKDVNTK